MATLPTPAADVGTWGTELNEFLLVGHTAAGVPTIADAVQTDTARATFDSTMWNPPTSNQYSILRITGTGRGTGTVSDRLMGLRIHVKDHASVAELSVTGATNATPIVVTTATHSLADNDRVAVYGVGGNTAANGAWTVNVLTPTTFELTGSVGSGAYTSGGTVTNRPMLTGLHVDVNTTHARGGLTGTAATGDDAAGVTIQNNGTHKATDAFYVAASPGIGSDAWETSLSMDAKSKKGIQLGGTYSTGGIDLALGTYTSYALRLPNNSPVMARNAAGSTDIEMMRFNASDRIQFSTTMQWVDGASVLLGSSAGSMLGSASSQKLGFWGATPVIRQTVTGSRGANAALASLLTGLAAAGIVTDSSSA